MKYERLTERIGKGICIKQTSTNDNKSIWNAIERMESEKEKKIEELKNCIVDNLFDGGTYGLAEALYNAGYRQIPEGSVVLSKEEYDKLCHLAYFGYDDVEEQARKETAKEIIKDFALSPRTRAMIMNKYGLTKEDFEK